MFGISWDVLDGFLYIFNQGLGRDEWFKRYILEALWIYQFQTTSQRSGSI